MVLMKFLLCHFGGHWLWFVCFIWWRVISKVFFLKLVERAESWTYNWFLQEIGSGLFCTADSSWHIYAQLSVCWHSYNRFVPSELYTSVIACDITFFVCFQLLWLLVFCYHIRAAILHRHWSNVMQLHGCIILVLNLLVPCKQSLSPILSIQELW